MWRRQGLSSPRTGGKSVKINSFNVSFLSIMMHYIFKFTNHGLMMGLKEYKSLTVRFNLRFAKF
jgi:hypothetical protein